MVNQDMDLGFMKLKKIAVINLMGNVFMKKSEDVFIAAKKLIKKLD